jgi:hypothetical protein
MKPEFVSLIGSYGTVYVNPEKVEAVFSMKDKDGRMQTAVRLESGTTEIIAMPVLDVLKKLAVSMPTMVASAESDEV